MKNVEQVFGAFLDSSSKPYVRCFRNSKLTGWGWDIYITPLEKLDEKYSAVLG